MVSAVHPSLTCFFGRKVVPLIGSHLLVRFGSHFSGGGADCEVCQLMIPGILTL